MKRCAVFGLVAVLAVSISGCGGDDPESLMKQSIAEMNALADALEKKESPDKIKAQAEKLKATMEKLDNIKLTKEKKDELTKKYEKELMGAAFKMMGAAMSNPEGAKAMESLGSLGKGK